MKCIPPIKPKTAVHTKQYNSDKHRREFSKGLFLGLILLAVFIVLSRGLLYGQESNNALFIDKDGNVTVAKKFDVKEGISVGGTVKAKKFEGDASALTVGGVEFVKQVKGNPPLTLEEVVRAVIADMVPIGTIMAYGGDVTRPEIRKTLEDQGWLPCDGVRKEVSKYKILYDIIGNAFGGDANYFFVPDMRGQFLRGVDYLKENEKREFRDPDVNERKHPTSGKKVGGIVGSVQEDQFKRHTGHLDYLDYQWTTTNAHTTGADKARKVNKIDPGGSAETRPKNIYVNWIIKAKHIIR